MEIVSQIIGGQHADILIRQKSGARLELGELLVTENNSETNAKSAAQNTENTKTGNPKSEKIILQVFDLQYGSQIQPEALEWASGLNLENVSSEGFLDANLRNYVLAKIKAVAHIKNGVAKTAKSLPPFFSGLRRIQDDDLEFLQNPQMPLFMGHVRSGSRVLNKEVWLDGAEVLSTHVVVAAGTGKGKSLDGEEKVLVRDQEGARLIPIKKLVSEQQQPGLEAYSVNPKTMKSSFKKITSYLRHDAPEYMYTVTTDSGRKIKVTGDHSIHVLRNGSIVLLPTDRIQPGDYAASSRQIELAAEAQSLNLLDLLESDKNVICEFPESFKQKIDRQWLQALVAKKNRGAKTAKAMLEENKIPLSMVRQCFRIPLTKYERGKVKLKLRLGTVSVPGEFVVTPEFARYIGYFLAEGSCYKHTAVRITNGNPEVQKDVIRFAMSIGAKAFRIKKGIQNTDTVISSRLLSLITTALVGNGSGYKRMPDFALGLPKAHLAELLRGYYEGDGGPEDGYRVSATTKSEALASGLCVCLSRFGIHTRIYEVYKKVSGSQKPKSKYYKVTVTGATQIQTFMKEIGFLYKKYPMKTLVENTNVDVIPVNMTQVRQVREALRLDQGELAHTANISRELLSMNERGQRRPSRVTFEKIIHAFENRIKKIESINTGKLRKAMKWLDPDRKPALLEGIRNHATLVDIAERMPCFSTYRREAAARGLHRMLRQVDSVHIMEAYNVIENDSSITPESLQAKLGQCTQTLNYPHPNLPDSNARCGYFASTNEKKMLRAKGIRQLIDHVLHMHEKAIGTKTEIESMKKLLNLRWEKIKSVEKKTYDKPYVYDISVEENETFYAGRGGLFVHNSNLTKCMLYKLLDSDYAGILILDPHNEYTAALRSHPQAPERLKAYSPNPERGAVLMRINFRNVKPWHFKGIVPFSEAQSETLWFYYKKFKSQWLEKILSDERDEELDQWYKKGRLKEGTLSVIQRRLELALDKTTFSPEGGQNTVADICDALDAGHKVVIDTSRLASETELLIGSILANEVFERAKRNTGKFKSIVIEEAPRVLREGESNVFSSIAREGRKFGVGLIAITQLASLIPREVLANMNTKIILGNEMRQEREALIASAAQDLTDDSKAIAGLDKGEAIISSVYTKFAIPVQFPKFETIAAENTSSTASVRRFV